MAIKVHMGIKIITENSHFSTTAPRGSLVSSADLRVIPEPESPILEVTPISAPGRHPPLKEARVLVMKMPLNHHISTIMDGNPTQTLPSPIMAPVLGISSTKREIIDGTKWTKEG